MHGDKVRLSVVDAAALSRDYKSIFTATVRSLIQAANDETIDCPQNGLMIGQGVVWIHKRDTKTEQVAIDVINMPKGEATGEAFAHGDSSHYRCTTDKHQIVIDDLGDKLRYRSWSKNAAASSAKPDLTLIGGQQTDEGTGSCRSASYQFKSGTITYTVMTLPCGPGEMPKQATGDLT